MWVWVSRGAVTVNLPVWPSSGPSASRSAHPVKFIMPSNLKWKPFLTSAELWARTGRRLRWNDIKENTIQHTHKYRHIHTHTPFWKDSQHDSLSLTTQMTESDAHVTGNKINSFLGFPPMVSPSYASDMKGMCALFRKDQANVGVWLGPCTLQNPNHYSKQYKNPDVALLTFV